MIGMSDYATRYLRDRTAARMEDTCRIFTPGKMVVGSDFKSRREPQTVKYEGPCRIWEVISGNQVVISDKQVVVSQTYLSLPYDAPVPESDDIVLITKSADPDLVGRTVSIVSVTRGGGLRASRKMLVRVVDSKKATW